MNLPSLLTLRRLRGGGIAMRATGLAILSLSAVSLSMGQLPDPSRTAAWVIEPGRALGPVKLGMTRDDVKAVAGEPGEKTVKEWDYSADSLRVYFSDDGHVSMLFGGLGWTKSQNNFKGQTADGIRMGSTRDEVIVACGTPRRTIKQDDVGLESLFYSESGLIIGVSEGRVVEVLVLLRDPRVERTRSSPSPPTP